VRFKVLVPAAGRSERFAAAGYLKPKPDLLIEYDGMRAKMLDWAISPLPRLVTGPVVVGAAPGMAGPDAACALVRVHNSRGQAHTLMTLIGEMYHRDEPLLIINSDVVFEKEDLSSICREVAHGADIGILVQRSDSTAMSYVDRVPYSNKYAEKLVISKFAMSGAWAFRSSARLLDALVSVQDMPEPYLSHAMNRMNGVHSCVVAGKILDWGTPDAVVASGARIVEER
jgi:hypothetical protein